MNIHIKQKRILGILLDEITYKSCRATIGVGDSFATVYSIESEETGKGHATELLICAKKYYEARGKIFGSSVALSGAMKHLLTKLNIPEYA